MARLAPVHWWYHGLRDMIAKTLAMRRFAIPAQSNVLDAGCGTGENLQLLKRRLDPAYLGGFDASPQAVELAQATVPNAHVYVSDICEPQVHVDQVDLLLSCDVLYIPGAAASLNGLKHLVAHLRPQGLFIVHLPAYQWLYSEHDVAVHTQQRFTARQVRHLMSQLGLSTELLTYRIFFLFPAIMLYRLRTIVGPRRKGADARSDLALPSALTNRLLATLLEFENTAISRGLQWPWGSSIYAVGRKP